MRALLPGLLIRYTATLIALQILMLILFIVAEALGWDEDLFRAANVAILIGSATTAGNYVGQQLRAKPSWSLSFGLAFFMSLVSLALGTLLVLLMLATGGVEAAEFSGIVDELGMGSLGAALVFLGFGLLLSYPVTLVGLRIGAGGAAKLAQKEDAEKAAKAAA